MNTSADNSTSRQAPADGTEELAPLHRLLSDRPRRYAAFAALLILIGIFIVFASEAWLGVSPFGSDNDEYRMVAEELTTSGRPVVAGVEGTKYPLGYPFVLILFGWFTPPATTAALVFNVALLAATGAGLWWALRSWGPVPAFAATAFLLINPTLWRSIASTMPDVAILALLAASLVVFRKDTLDEGTVLAATAVSVVAVTVKSIGVLIAAASSVVLWRAGGAVRRKAWLPAVASAVALGAQAVWVRRYPAHTTGYSETFLLRDVSDYSQGTLGVVGLLARVRNQIGPTIDDLADAIVSPQITGAWVAWLTVILLALALFGRGNLAWFLITFGLLHGAALLVWPYQSDRLQMPMVMVAALGVAAGVKMIQRVRPAALTAVVLLTAAVGIGVLGLNNRDRVEAVAARDRTTHTTWTDNVAAFDDWAAANIGADESIASLDYRELAYRVDRAVVPLGYTRDPEALLDEIAQGDAEWFIRLGGLFGRRTSIAQGLLDARPELFELVFESSGLEVFRIKPS